MARSDVLALAQVFAHDQADAAALDDFYTRTVEQYGRFPLMTNATLVSLTAGTATYAMASSIVKLIAAFYDNKVLALQSLRDMEALSADWRSWKGMPVAYVVEGETTKTLRLFPNPDLPSDDFIFLFGSPFGQDYPDYSLAIVHTEIRETVMPYLELPLAFEILAREYERESSHRDPDLALICRKIGQVLLTMVL